MNSSELPHASDCKVSGAAYHNETAAQQQASDHMVALVPASLELTSLPPNFGGSEDLAVEDLTHRSRVSSTRGLPMRVGAQAELPTAFLSDDDSDDELWRPDLWCPASTHAPSHPTADPPTAAGQQAALLLKGRLESKLSHIELLDAPTAHIAYDIAGRFVEMHHFQVKADPNSSRGEACDHVARIRDSLRIELLAAG
jgi:hypothetical protein